ncbi:DUF202 domain-containing protein [Corynebacterium liangguodongii]|uniref:DUF202 domain-containing protein n=2 Tax=Corynebacterium liangguodongii TaxID=2079535 RepID=A0A2S0WHD4_9CORY|nr:DUF202 domain-containing protein [Corynebacterium liangguodongii]PWB99420.1 DUF202 domain-containing protein [Corynebacterium liangguodongii]
MSWTRTALAMQACALVLVRWSDTHPGIVKAAIFLLSASALWLIVGNRQVYRNRAAWMAAGARPEPDVCGVALTTAMLLVLGGAELALLLA